MITESKRGHIDMTITLPKEPGSPTDEFQVVTPMDVLKHVPCPSSLRKAAMQHIMLGGWLVFYTILRTLVSFERERFVAQDILGIVRGGMRDWNIYINEGAPRAFLKGRRHGVRFLF
ncbi:hypothetical protein HOY80DRAFT_690311 [Tuber brumale]|nr:hypothetical protein HOY80DRAFT_690311 [Tuber brumale]